MPAVRVLPDANVLYKRTSRDWLGLLQAATGGEMFLLYYTEDIVAEAIARIRDNNPGLDGGDITRIADLLRDTMERLDDFDNDPVSYPGSDEGDLHIHSAAQSAGIDKLLTYDNGFLKLTGAQKDLLTYEIFAPDDFLTLVQDTAPEVVREVTRQQFEYWSERVPGTRPDLPGKLAAAGCPRFAAVVETHLRSLRL